MPKMIVAFIVVYEMIVKWPDISRKVALFLSASKLVKTSN